MQSELTPPHPRTAVEMRLSSRATATQVPARWRVPLGVAWVGITTFTLAVFFLNLPTYYRYLLHLCLQAQCSNQQLNVVQALALRLLGMTVQTYALLTVWLNVAFALVFLVTAALIVLRKADDWLAAFTALTLITFGFGAFVGVGDILPPDDKPMLIATQTSAYIGNLFIFLFFLVFPNGRLVPRWGLVPWALFSLVNFFRSFFINTPYDPNRIVPYLNDIAFIGIIAFSIGAQFYRYRVVSNAVERAQTKWVVFSSIFSLIVFVGLTFIVALNPELNNIIWLFLIGNILLYGVIALIPISIAVAILRSHLWDIDILIRRTVTYSLLSAALLIIFFGCILVLQLLFASLTGARQNELVTVLSTLAIAALFVPLRSRIQKGIDRRFNRNAYDAQQVLNAFAQAVRDETDLEQLTARLMQVVNETMQPNSVSVWLKREDR